MRHIDTAEFARDLLRFSGVCIWLMWRAAEGASEFDRFSARIRSPKLQMQAFLESSRPLEPHGQQQPPPLPAWTKLRECRIYGLEGSLKLGRFRGFRVAGARALRACEYEGLSLAIHGRWHLASIAASHPLKSKPPGHGGRCTWGLVGLRLTISRSFLIVAWWGIRVSCSWVASCCDTIRDRFCMIKPLLIFIILCELQPKAPACSSYAQLSIDI